MQYAALFKFVPDFSVSWKEASLWIEKSKFSINKFCSRDAASAEFCSLGWAQIAHEIQVDPLFGLYSSTVWRKFVLSVFLADLVCYSAPIDQVDFARLLFVMHSFPHGFRLWWIKLQGATWCPIGYSGWYPIDEASFSIMDQSPEALKSRMVNPVSLQENPYLYLFNFSVAACFKKTAISKALVTQLAAEIQVQKPLGLSCITVSEDGVRVATEFGMQHRGNFEIQGSFEGVYTC